MNDRRAARQLDLLERLNSTLASRHTRTRPSCRPASRASSWPTGCRWRRRSAGRDQESRKRSRSSTAWTTRSAATSPSSADGPAAGGARRALRADLQRRNERSWDGHTDIAGNHRQFAGETDMPIAGLLTDLKQRGLLDSTLVIWGGEFGRLPVSQRPRTASGRDHNPHAFTTWFAGGGVKGGVHTARPTRSATRRPSTACRSTTCTPPSCTCSAWTTRS